MTGVRRIDIARESLRPTSRDAMVEFTALLPVDSFEDPWVFWNPDSTWASLEWNRGGKLISVTFTESGIDLFVEGPGEVEESYFFSSAHLVAERVRLLLRNKSSNP